MSERHQIVQLAIGPYLYAALSEQIIALRRVRPHDDALTYGSVLVPVLRLAALLDLPDQGTPRHALLVMAHNRWQGLTVDAVQTLLSSDSADVRPLPDLLTRRKNASWVRGSLLLDGRPLLVLDLQAIVGASR